MGSNVRNYTDSNLLNKVATLEGFKDIPKDFWLIGVRSNEDAYNVFDDKFYLFQGKKCISVYLGTTNAGATGLKKFDTYNKLGVAVLKADTIVYDYAYRGLHKGKVEAYRQGKGFPYFRDNDKDEHVEEIGKEYNDIIYANIHPSSYVEGQDVDKEFINGWSLACQVFANRAEFDDFMDLTEGQKNLTYCLLQEFEPGEEC